MKKRHAFTTAAVVLLMTPVALLVGPLLVIPAVLVLLPILAILAVAALPALFVAAAQPAEAVIVEPLPLPAAVACSQ
jgi:hypothetical protein